MSNIQISDSEARSIRSLFNTHGWETYITMIRRAREKCRDAMETSARDEKTKQLQGVCLILRDICNVEEDIRKILKDDNN